MRSVARPSEEHPVMSKLPLSRNKNNPAPDQDGPGLFSRHQPAGYLYPFGERNEGTMQKNIVQLNDINRMAAQQSANWIQGVEREYNAVLDQTAERIQKGGQRIVMLAGPSGSGKTTTANMLSRHLVAHGAQAAVISLDDFYLNPQDMPRLDDGTPDFESVHSLDLDHLHRCLCDLLETRRCELPLFDFITHRIEGQTRLLELGEGDVVIFEGLHALNPIICDRLPAHELCRLHVHVGQSIQNEGETLLSARDLRLVRRLIRDHRFRNSTPSNTLEMWKGVVRGEEQYLKPFEHTASISVDSFHCYEPCVFRDPFLELLKQVDPADANYPLMERVGKALALLAPLPMEEVPSDSLLREFIGK